MLPTIVTVNPMRKRRRRVKNRHHRHHSRARTRVANRHRRHRHRRSNPFKIGGFSLQHDLIPALVGGAGAVGVDVGLAYLSPYLPAFLQSGWGRLLAQAVAAVGIGYGARVMIDSRTGAAVTAGGLVVTAYSGLRQVLAPTLGTTVKGLSGLADFSDYQRSGWDGAQMTQAPALSAYMPQGAYMRAPGLAGGRMGRLGYMNPGSVLTGLRQKQLAAYMPQSGFGSFGGAYSEDM